MVKTKKVKITVKPVNNERYGDESIVTRDRDLTQGEIDEIYDKAKQRKIEAEAKESPIQPDEPSVAAPKKKGLLKLKCECGHVANISDEVIEDGLSWSMLIGNNHFLTLACEKCGSKLTMYIEEITDQDELPKEGNAE
jgi:predicted nucleic-acid-binding Zn-ribbon protein